MEIHNSEGMYVDRQALGSFVISFFLSLFSSRNWCLFPVIPFILSPFSLFVDTMTWIPLRSVLVPPTSAHLHGTCKLGLLCDPCHTISEGEENQIFFASTPIVTLSGKQPTICILVNSMVFVLSRLESWGHMFIPT